MWEFYDQRKLTVGTISSLHNSSIPRACLQIIWWDLRIHRKQNVIKSRWQSWSSSQKLVLPIAYLTSQSAAESAILNNTTRDNVGHKFSENMDSLCCSSHQPAGMGLPQGPAFPGMGLGGRWEIGCRKRKRWGCRGPEVWGTSFRLTESKGNRAWAKGFGTGWREENQDKEWVFSSLYLLYHQDKWRGGEVEGTTHLLTIKGGRCKGVVDAAPPLLVLCVAVRSCHTYMTACTDLVCIKVHTCQCIMATICSIL